MSEVLAEVIEQKYCFTLPTRDKLEGWLEYAMEADPVHAEGVVNSLYYDTPDLALYAQKRASEYLKFKVRLRWYGDAKDMSPEHPVPCFLEVKRKIGSTRRKRRSMVPVPAGVLASSVITSDEIAALAELALENNYPAHSPLVPMAHIRYRRKRYIDPATGARIALDWEIGCGSLNQDHLFAEPPAWLNQGVLEVKGRMRHLPRSLEPVAFLLYKSAFSKYAQCLEKLVYPEGVRI